MPFPCAMSRVPSITAFQLKYSTTTLSNYGRLARVASLQTTPISQQGSYSDYNGGTDHNSSTFTNVSKAHWHFSFRHFTKLLKETLGLYLFFAFLRWLFSFHDTPRLVPFHSPRCTNFSRILDLSFISFQPRSLHANDALQDTSFHVWDFKICATYTSNSLGDFR